MALSIYLAKLFGLYLILVGVFYLSRRALLLQIVHSFFDEPAWTAWSGMLALLAGLALVIGHSVWVWGWPVMLTLFGYLAVLKGILRLFFPQLSKQVAYNLTTPRAACITGIACILVGLFLTYEGFWGN